MKVITYNHKEYFVDGVPTHLQKKLDISSPNILFDEDKPVFFYNHKNFQENPIYLNDAISILKDIEQPYERKVSYNMLWGLGYGESLDYAIKAGGESESDHMFSSHLKVTVADEKTGLDKDVIILKKYSKEFFEVLITEKEVLNLYGLCKTPKEKELIDVSKMEGYIYLLLKCLRKEKIQINNNIKLASEKQIEKIKEKLSQCDRNSIKKHIDMLISRKKEYLKVSLDEKLSSITTKEYHSNIKKDIKYLNGLMEYSLV